MTIRIAVVDDQDLIRAGFRMLVDSQDDLEVVAEAADGVEALEVLARVAVDVVLMDVRMPRLDGVEATRALTARGSTAKVVVLTTFDLDDYVYSALQAGAAAFLLKDSRPEALLGAIRAVHGGDAVVAPSATRRLVERFVTGAAVPDTAVLTRLDDLTEREREVLTLIAQGLSNTEIAARLVVAEATVKTHVGRVLAKTGSRDRVQLVVLGYEAGLVAPGRTTGG